MAETDNYDDEVIKTNNVFLSLFMFFRFSLEKFQTFFFLFAFSDSLAKRK